jgi:hypothetical protein
MVLSLFIGKSFFVATITMLLLFLLTPNANHIALSQEMQPTQAHDSVTVLMDGKVIPGKSFLHLYDSTPSSIGLGHVAAHLPCDGNGEEIVKVVGGVAPNVSPLNLTLVDQMSSSGSICMYHTDIPTTPQQQNSTITDIALLNPTEQNITLPDATSVVIHISEFGSPVAGDHS